MIPFSILSGTIEPGTREIRVLELRPNGFTFRLPRILDGQTVQSIKLRFFVFQQNEFISVQLQEFTTEQLEQTAFYTLYQVHTTDPVFRRASNTLMREYMNYITLKLEEDDAGLSQALVGYPAQLEQCFPENFLQQKRDWFSNIASDAWDTIALTKLALALSLDAPWQYQSFLQQPLQTFCAQYWQKNHLAQHSLAKQTPKYLYIGNQFCPLLFPALDVLQRILDKALTEDLIPVLVFSTLPEHAVEQTEQVLNWLDAWCKQYDLRLELVLNDWGMLNLMQKYTHFIYTLGSLLNKRRKDTRIPYKNGSAHLREQLKQNPLQADFYINYLKEKFHISRIEYEACGYAYEIAHMPASLHLPFYQMNTAQHCTLYAVCKNGARSRQQPVYACPNYCENSVFLYPQMLSMVGRYNSLFGYDTEILRDANAIQSFLSQGVDRIIINLL